MRQLFEALQEGGQTAPILMKYAEIAAYLGLEQVPLDIEAISNRFHDHVQGSGRGLKEHDFLVTSRDRLCAEPALPITVYLDHIRSAHNVGSILRTIEAFSLGKVLFSEKTPRLEHPQVQKASMGAWKWIEETQEIIRPVVVLETSALAKSVDDFVFPESFTLVLGNEEYGVSQSLLAQADHLIQIPMFGRKNSLNVANAFAIVAHRIAATSKKRSFQSGLPDGPGRTCYSGPEESRIRTLEATP